MRPLLLALAFTLLTSTASAQYGYYGGGVYRSDAIYGGYGTLYVPPAAIYVGPAYGYGGYGDDYWTARELRLIRWELEDANWRRSWAPYRRGWR